MTREHPILFSAPMVLALLGRRKTVTRRLSKSWLKVKAGDTLWVRETWRDHMPFGCELMLELAEFRATPWPHALPSDEPNLKWKPSIFMPRWASRINLRATEDARLERLHDITAAEASREGCSDRNGTGPYLSAFGGRRIINNYAHLWDALHGKNHPWKSNPEVVRVAFEVLP